MSDTPIPHTPAHAARWFAQIKAQMEGRPWERETGSVPEASTRVLVRAAVATVVKPRREET